jgi:cell division protein ZipA
MDGLRWLLLLFGLLVIAGVYFYSRRERNKKEISPPASTRIEPSLKAGETIPDSEDIATAGDAEAEAPLDDDADETPALGEKIVTLRLVARQQGTFPGDDLVLSMRGLGMRHGKFGIFHRYEGDDESKVIFSAASLVEPGSFDLENIKSQQIPGISLFMVLPGPMEGAQGYDLMVAAGRALAKSLNAELLDESGSTFSIQRERYLREEIIQYQHGIKVA